MSKQKILFIINPSSGSSFTRKHLLGKNILEYLDNNVYLPEVYYSTSPQNVEEACLKAVASGVETIVAAGGDGSVNLVARTLTGTGTVLGIIPAGSGNGLAHHLKIPLNIREAVNIINRRKTAIIDSVFVNDKSFFSIAGVGFDALVAREYSRSKLRGFLPYFKIVASRYPFYKPKNYELNIDGTRIERRALFVVFANSGQFGYNTMIAPNAQLSDGLMDVCIARKVPLIRVPFLVHHLFNGTIDHSEYIEIFKARHVEVKRKRNRRINLDGESVKLTKNLVVKVNPGSLRVIIP